MVKLGDSLHGRIREAGPVVFRRKLEYLNAVRQVIALLR